MELNAQNINSLEDGQKVWFIDHVMMPDKLTYVGVVDQYHTFVGGNTIKKVLHGKEELSDLIRYGSKLFTTYEESCIELRKHLLNHIDHWNKHQLKGMEVPISEDDQQYLWFNVEKQRQLSESTGKPS